MTERTCTKCGVAKPLGEYYVCNGKPIAACKDCTKAARRAYVAENREKVKADLRAWHHANRERQNERSREYRREHLEELQAQARARYVANREALLARHSEVYSLVRLAMKRGELVKEPCLFCDEERVEAHHHDYSKPLDVTWLCVRHHRLAHKIVDQAEAA
jgi:hypothetical protein